MAVYNYPVHIALPDEDVITCLHKDEICAKNGVPIFCAFCPLCLRSLSAPVGDLSTSKYLQCEHIGRYHKKCLDSLGLKACLYCRPNLIKLTDEEGKERGVILGERVDINKHMEYVTINVYFILIYFNFLSGPQRPVH